MDKKKRKKMRNTTWKTDLEEEHDMTKAYKSIIFPHAKLSELFDEINTRSSSSNNNNKNRATHNWQKKRKNKEKSSRKTWFNNRQKITLMTN